MLITRVINPSDIRALQLNETLFHNANGYLGVRGALEEGGYAPSVRGLYINGFYEFVEMKQAEALCGLVTEKQTTVNIADVLNVKLTVCGEEFSLFTGTVHSAVYSLDMDAGVTKRHVDWTSPNGRRVNIEIVRMASFKQPSLFTIEMRVTPVNFTGDIEFVSTIDCHVRNFSDPDDPRVGDESEPLTRPDEPARENGAEYVTTKTGKSLLTACMGMKNLRKTGVYEGSELLIQSGLPLTLRKKTVTLTKLIAVTDSLRHSDCETACRDVLNEAEAKGMSYWYACQREILADYWKSCRIDIQGDDELNLALRFNQYQLFQSATRDEHGNVAAKGLSGEGYEGHFFWDTEMFILPVLSLADPDIARKLIAFRHHTLPQAIENARILGHTKGALYPWRTIMGRECSGYFPSGTAQYHINGDIAYAIVRYWLLTKDKEFLRKTGLEVLIETARLWLDAGHFDPLENNRFVINAVTGPDEYTCMVNNNYYTNVLAQYNLEWAVKAFRLAGEQGLFGVTEDELARFEAAARAMYLPYDEVLDINPQDDSFLHKKPWDFANTPPERYPLLLNCHPLHLYRHQVCKQADTVLAHFILEDKQSLSTMKNSYDYYERITTHDSSLSACVFSIMAAKLGLTDKAYDYFGTSALLDLLDTHGNTKDGLHIANMGGAVMAIIYGFGGLRVKEDGFHLAPVLPRQWSGYSFRFIYEGTLREVNVTADGYTVRAV
ncbi:MAG: family 65 glycosyl hydrolase [Defluviitaleaceae bacterium]|nr:family 65 glycosyl hydrolase [Defluviitaleaceae bacterium]